MGGLFNKSKKSISNDQNNKVFNQNQMILFKEENYNLYFNIRNLQDKELLLFLQKRLSPSLNDLMKYIKSKDFTISIIGILLLKDNYEGIFRRKLIKRFFYFNDPSELEKYPNNENKLWELKAYNNICIYIQYEDKEKLMEINKSIYNNLSYLINSIKNEKNSINNELKETKLCYIDSMMQLLCNIYDLDSNFYEYYFQDKWINMFTMLFELFFDFNSLPEVMLGMNQYPYLFNFLNLFGLCMTKDNNFQLRKKLLENDSSFLYKILIISTYSAGQCCCGHGYDKISYSCQKAIDSIYKVMSNIEKNNDFYLLKNAKEIKIKYTEFLMNKYGKNICGVYLNKLLEICSKEDIFTYIIINTNLLKEVMIREVTKIHHSIDCLEEMVGLCQNPEIFINILNDLTSSDDIILHKRLYREMLKKMINSLKGETVEKLLFKNLIFRIIDLISVENITHLSDIEGIFDILLNGNDFIVQAFYKNKYKVGKKFYNVIARLNQNSFIGVNMCTTLRIMNMLLSVGEKIKEKYNCENYFVNDLRESYNILPLMDDEEFTEIKKFYQN